MKKITFGEIHWSYWYRRSWKSVLFLVLLMLVICVIDWKTQEALADYSIKQVEPKIKEQRTISELWGKTKSLEELLSKGKPKYSQKEIEDYVRVIFGKDAKVAIAVSHHECGPTNRSYPGCVNKSDVEHSIGLFQINLYNKKHWIHASKVPGKTMEERIASLKDPKINTLVAFKIFKDWGGFTAWSAYTNGNYLLSLKENK